MNKTETTNQLWANPRPKESLSVEYMIKIRGDGQDIVEVASGFEIPLALHQGHQSSAYTAYQKVFEHLVNQPLQMRLNEFLGQRYQGGRRQTASETASGAEPAASGAVSGEPSSPVSGDPPEALPTFGTATQVQPRASSSVKLRAAA